MGQIRLSGSLIAGPPTVSDGVFPTAISTVALSTKESPKLFTNGGQILSRTLQTVVDTFTDLGEPGHVVTAATFLYLRTDTLVLARITVDNGAGGSVVLTSIPIDGLFICEYPTARFMKKLEIDTRGAQATLEYLVAGT